MSFLKSVFTSSSKARLALPIIAAWTAHYLIVFFAPFDSAQPTDFRVHILNLAFVTISMTTYFLTYRSIPAPRSGKNFGISRRWIWVLLGVISLAVLSLIYDRIFIQDIDFSNGFAQARTDWVKKGEARVGVSSIFSVFGNLFFPLAVPVIIFALLNRHSFSRVMLTSTLIICVLAIISVSALSGSRGYMFMTCFFVVSSAVALLASGVWKSISRRVVLTTSILLATCLFYAMVVILDRAEHSSMSASNYAKTVVEYVGGRAEFETKMGTSAENKIEQFGYAFTGALAYVSHADWTTNRAMRLEHTPGFYTANNSLLLLKRAGVIDEVVSIPVSGFMISLPGALWYDFGFVGALLIAAFLGSLLSFFVSHWLAKPSSLAWHFSVINLLALLTMAPFAYLFDFATYPFCVFNCLIVVAVNNLSSGT